MATVSAILDNKALKDLGGKLGPSARNFFDKHPMGLRAGLSFSVRQLRDQAAELADAADTPERKETASAWRDRASNLYRALQVSDRIADRGERKKHRLIIRDEVEALAKEMMTTLLNDGGPDEDSP